MELAVHASEARVKDAIEKHPSYRAFTPVWKSMHRLWLFDFGHAPEHQEGYKAGVTPKSCKAYAKARLGAAMALLTDGSMLLVLDGNSRAC